MNSENTPRAICFAGISVMAAVLAITAVILAPYGTLGFLAVCALAAGTAALSGVVLWAAFRAP